MENKDFCTQPPYCWNVGLVELSIYQLIILMNLFLMYAFSFFIFFFLDLKNKLSVLIV